MNRPTLQLKPKVTVREIHPQAYAQAWADGFVTIYTQEERPRVFLGSGHGHAAAWKDAANRLSKATKRA